MNEEQKIVVGVTEWHGMMQEQSLHPPTGVEYLTAYRKRSIFNKLVQSPIKGFFPVISDPRLDVVESLISPVLTQQRWVCSLASYHEIMAFSLAGAPLPRFARQAILKCLFRRSNFLGFAFWSNAGLRTMLEMRGMSRDYFNSKAKVIYPAVSQRPDFAHAESGRPRFLFSGDFFRKGGLHVIDAFERFQSKYPDAILHVCSDPDIDFNISDPDIRYKYLKKLRNNPSVVLGRVRREVILDQILPCATALLLPTYDEAFGFAALEALAHGVPVISTTEFALPEIIDHGLTGWLIPYSVHEKKMIMKGYIVQCIPEKLKDRITEELLGYMYELVSNTDRLSKMREASQEVARTRFSFSVRNSQLLSLYGLDQ